MDIPENENNVPTNPKGEQNENFSFDMVNASICMEGKCFIFRQIDRNIILRILKNTQASIINANIKTYSDESSEIKEEIIKFYEFFDKSIRNRDFIQLTIYSILAYLIRRYFFPTYFFDDPSFFSFEHNKHSTEHEYKKKFSNILFSSNHQQYVYNLQAFVKEPKPSICQTYDFRKSDFIQLRQVYENENSNFYLVVHIQSLYIFMLKVIKKQFTSSCLKHEVDFCLNCSHRCFNRFYGFLTENGQINGFVYEFLSNGSLLTYIQNDKKNDEISEFFTLMTINRLFQGIEYIHSNHQIHRDIKPANVLLDHDNIPYFSDFETIRLNQINNENDFFTNDIGSNLYVSPEQYSNENKCSYPTDIYSFGLIIYFLYEKKEWTNIKDCFLISKLKEEEFFPKMKKGTKNIQNIYNYCTKYNSNERYSLTEIKNILFNEFKSIDYFENLLLEQTKKLKISELIQYVYENGLFIYNYTKSEDDMMIYAYVCFLLLYYYLRKVYIDSNFIEIDYSIQTDYFNGFFDSQIFLMLGTFYEKGQDVNQDYFKAKKYYKLAARLNYSKAYLNLGCLYQFGLCGEKKFNKALKCFEIASIENDSDAFLNIGNLYKESFKVLDNYLIAKKYYELAINRNKYNSNALFQLGMLYMKGLGVKRNYLIAKDYFEKSIKDKNCQSDSFYYLGMIYYNGLVVIHNYQYALYYYQIAASKNNSNALLNLGNMYEFGKGVEQNYNEAKKYYELASNFNNSGAFINLGNLYTGEKGFPRDFQKAKKYYELAADLNDSTALLLLGNLYMNDYYGERDYLKSFYYFELAIKIDNNRFAICNLGRIYLNGLGVPQTFSKAIVLFELGKKLKDPYSILTLAIMYRDGYGVKQDYSKAKELFQLGGELNDSNSIFNLGILYLNGHGVEQDFFKAIQYLEMSANLNNNAALYMLAFAYECELYFEIDIQKVINLYSKCISIQRGNFVSYNEKENIYTSCFSENNYRYFSYNNLGLIYFTFFNDIEKSLKNLELAANAELALAQSNYSILLIEYKNDYVNSKYFLNRASKQKFCIADFLLGHLSKKEGHFENSINFYLKASDHGNEPLKYRGFFYGNITLNISILFVICLTNIKLFLFYLEKSNFDLCKKYFNRTFSTIIKEDQNSPQKFTFMVNKDGLEFIKHFILSFPLFNLINQPNLNDFDASEFLKLDHFDAEFEEYEDSIEKNKKVKKLIDQDMKNNLQRDVLSKIDHFDEKEIEVKNHFKEIKQNEDKLKVLNELLDIVIQDKELTSLFVNSIKELIEIMTKILFKPPFQILFGSINLKRPKTKGNEEETIYPFSRYTDESFYEGIGIDIGLY